MKAQQPSSNVMFPNDKNMEKIKYIPSRHELSTEEKRDIWYNKADYKRFDNNIRKMSKEAKRCGYSSLLDETYGAAVFSNDKSTIDFAQGLLNNWCRYGYSTRGLEVDSSSQHRRERHKDQVGSTAIVLQTQKFIKKGLFSSMIGDEYCNWEEKVARAYELVTGNAKLFAYMIGKADEYAASSELVINDHAHDKLLDPMSAADYPTKEQYTSAWFDIEPDVLMPRQDMKVNSYKHDGYCNYNKEGPALYKATKNGSKKGANAA